MIQKIFTKFLKKIRKGKLKLKGLHEDQPPAIPISKLASLGE